MTAKKTTQNIAPVRTRVLIVDDHPMVREWLMSLINQESDLLVCGQAESRLQALEVAATTKPDVAIVDLEIKSSHGLELVKDFKSRFPRLAVLVLSASAETVYAERALYAGARGYLAKQAAPLAVLQAIRRVAAGGVSFSEKLTQQLLARMTGTRPATAASLVEQLSDRELEVLQLIGVGDTTGQIAAQLHLAPNTVDTYRVRIREKLGLTKTGALLHYAIRWVHCGQTPEPVRPPPRL